MPAHPDTRIDVPVLRAGVAAAASVVLLVPFGLLAAWVAGRWGPLHDFDATVTDTLHDWALRHPAMVDAMSVWTNVFSPTALRVAALILVIWLFRRQARRAAWWVIVTMTAGGAVNALLKLLIGRDRPSLLDPVAEAAGYAFPSGHAANAAVAAAVFLLIFLPFRRARAALWTAAVVVPVLTGLTRIGLGVHWTSDVVAGWLLGLAVVAATTIAFARRPGRVLSEGLTREVTVPSR